MYLHPKGHYYALILIDGKNKYIGLGRDYREALLKYTDLVAPVEGRVCLSFGGLVERYVETVLPQKSHRYCKEQTRLSRFVIAGLGEIPIEGVKPRIINRYLTHREKQSGALTAQQERALIAGVCKMACKSGDMNDNPMRSVPSRSGIVKSKRVVEAAEIVAFWEFCRGSIVADYVRFKVLTGLRKDDILKIHRSQLRDDGIHITVGKTGRRIVIRWSPALREVVSDLQHGSMFLFSTKHGRPYTYSGFNAMWQRKMRAAKQSGVLEERFKDSDLRAFVADAVGLDHAKELLAHASSATTERHYRRKPRSVDPGA